MGKRKPRPPYRAGPLASPSAEDVAEYRCPGCELKVVKRPCLVCVARAWSRAKAEGRPLPPVPNYLQEPRGPGRPSKTPKTPPAPDRPRHKEDGA